MSPTDPELKHDVEAALRADPLVNAVCIGVEVADGDVCLVGEVGTCDQRRAAEEAAQRVRGVWAVRDELVVAPRGRQERTDEEIAWAVRSTLGWAWDPLLPASVITTVHRGWVALHGQVYWGHQRAAAVRAVSRLAGVVGVVDGLTVTPGLEGVEAGEPGGVPEAWADALAEVLGADDPAGRASPGAKAPPRVRPRGLA